MKTSLQTEYFVYKFQAIKLAYLSLKKVDGNENFGTLH